jgi:2-keto-3-deoxy-L-rhamnonate aldolase RhmA
MTIGTRGDAAAREAGVFHLLLFTTDPALAADAVSAGIDCLVVDWERHGKHRRQADADTEINRDTPEDLRRVRAAVHAPVLCRIDAFGPQTASQLDEALACGADEILLPMVRSPEEVRATLDLTRGRCRLGILVETVDAVRRIGDLAELPLARVYVGLNDLAIERGTPNIFTSLADGTVERVCATLAAAGIPYGFGGLTLPDRGGPIPCRLLLAEMVHLGCTFSFLRRSFRRDTAGRPLGPAVASIRAALSDAAGRPALDVRRDTRDLYASILAWGADTRASTGA